MMAVGLDIGGMGGSEIVIVGDRAEGLELRDLPARPAAFLEAYRLTGAASCGRGSNRVQQECPLPLA